MPKNPQIRPKKLQALHEAGVGCVYGPGGRLACGPLDDHLPRPFHESQANHIIAALEKP